MIVHYYSIYNCQFCNDSNNHPILVPPPNMDPAVLNQQGFILSPNNTWIHYLTEQEYNYIIANQHLGEISFIYNETSYSAPETPEEKKNGDRLALTSLGLLVAPLGISMLLALYFNMTSSGDIDASTLTNSPIATFLEGLMSMCRLGSLVTMIITRVKYPKNKLGKIMMWVYIVLGILLVIAIILLIIACGQCIEEMRHCPG